MRSNASDYVLRYTHTLYIKKNMYREIASLQRYAGLYNT